MNSDDIDLFCKVFIDTDFGREEVVSFVSESIDGTIERWSVSNKYCNLDLLRNDDFNEAKRAQGPDGFLFSRYYLEIEPNEETESSAYIKCISELLTKLWNNGFKAVAACDFEDVLPRKGGYDSTT
ncbi:hypothetical protein [Cohnella panacarvi]|uniref:hypothetical protein n=1 Tax=Cohnella panacarvi TaxID=400776 RepID=UPI00047C145B|nr:hypothetical protein [Cohnella panacarvi]